VQRERTPSLAGYASSPRGRRAAPPQSARAVVGSGGRTATSASDGTCNFGGERRLAPGHLRALLAGWRRRSSTRIRRWSAMRHCETRSRGSSPPWTRSVTSSQTRCATWLGRWVISPCRAARSVGAATPLEAQATNPPRGHPLVEAQYLQQRPTRLRSSNV